MKGRPSPTTVHLPPSEDDTDASKSAHAVEIRDFGEVGVVAYREIGGDSVKPVLNGKRGNADC